MLWGSHHTACCPELVAEQPACLRRNLHRQSKLELSDGRHNIIWLASFISQLARALPVCPALCRQSKLELPDGRHRIEWFLIDEADDEHLAIVGEEKETRDGHYLYRTHGVFDTTLPLQVRGCSLAEGLPPWWDFEGTWGVPQHGVFGPALLLRLPGIAAAIALPLQADPPHTLLTDPCPTGGQPARVGHGDGDGWCSAHIGSQASC